MAPVPTALCEPVGLAQVISLVCRHRKLSHGEVRGHARDPELEGQSWDLNPDLLQFRNPFQRGPLLVIFPFWGPLHGTFTKINNSFLLPQQGIVKDFKI